MLNTTKWISPDRPALVLAPMEGVTDAPMRELLTRRGGFTYCVSEFLRVSQNVLPPKTYFEHVPELLNHCQTRAGTPIQFQLLGGDEEKMALSAVRAVELGAGAVDINFGCPAKTVNRNDGGAALLRYPHRIRSIVAAVRQAVPAHIPVSAKLRLGWENCEDIYTTAEQAVLGGASWLTIHARTKAQGYAPPAHWQYIGEVRKRVPIPVVANGDIWTREDFLRCQSVTGCQHFMIGRGALADPSLPFEISRLLGLEVPASTEAYPFSRISQDWEAILNDFAQITEPISMDNTYTVRRIKQWLGFVYFRSQIPWFNLIKRAQTLDEVFSILRQP